LAYKSRARKGLDPMSHNMPRTQYIGLLSSRRPKPV
jgi:hypothetical protein